MPRWRVLRPGYLGTEADRATFRTLHTATQMTSELRTGLTRASAEHCVRPLARLLGSPAVAVTDTSDTLAWYGVRHGHADLLGPIAERCVSEGRTGVRVHRDFDCGEPGCPLRQAIVAPLTVEDTVVGTLIAFTPSAAARLVRATDELAQWVSGQLELAELDVARTSRMEAEVRALRAQISPHFVYNVLTTIASFVRTDPDRARELHPPVRGLHPALVPAGRQLHHARGRAAVDRALPGARAGQVRRPARRTAADRPGGARGEHPRTLACNPWSRTAYATAWRARTAGGTITILAEDNDYEAVITVEDDGVGEDPDRVRRALAGDESMDSIGLGNVDQRLRSAYGDEYGLVVETAPGAGTRVTVRVPKFAAGVRG